MRFLLLSITLILARIPQEYVFEYSQLYNQDDGLKSNMIVDIESLDNTIFLSSSDGLGYSESSDGGFAFLHFDDNNLPEGGNPAMIVKDNVIAVSGSITVLDLGAYYPAGTGVSYSLDGGATWKYMSQPIDPMPNLWSCSNYNYSSLFFDNKAECELSCINCNGEPGSCARLYDFINWGGQDNIAHLSITTAINNVSYDLDVNGDYIYSTSWAGGLRRFNYTLLQPVWESVPLPLDNQNELICGDIDLSSYQLNPVGDCGSDYDNHKPFSVYSIDDTIWVGTAAGINKGIVNGDCIDWTHLRSYEYGFYDDWVIGFESQELTDGSNRIWAITWDKETQGSIGPPSFSDDGGDSWSFSSQLVDLGVKSYNISFNQDDIYLSTDQGMFLSQDGVFWESFSNFIDYQSGEQILSDIVYDAKVINNNLWVGTQDGIAISNNLINPDWDVYRFWKDDILFSAYPNPFLMNTHNIINNEGHVRFVSDSQNLNASIDIFDFSMDKVITLDSPIISNNQIEFIWNGKSEFGSKVNNGVYFCRLNDSGRSRWVKLAVLGD